MSNALVVQTASQAPTLGRVDLNEIARDKAQGTTREANAIVGYYAGRIDRILQMIVVEAASTGVTTGSVAMKGPWPKRYRESLFDGALADRARNALNAHLKPCGVDITGAEPAGFGIFIDSYGLRFSFAPAQEEEVHDAPSVPLLAGPATEAEEAASG